MKRTVKLLALYLLRAAGVFRLAQWIMRDRVRILGYHGIWLGDERFGGDMLFMRPETFRARLAMIRRRGFTVISMDDAVAGLRGEKPLPAAALVITIDDGWLGTFSVMWPALRAYGMPATLYVDTGNMLAGEPVAHVLARYGKRIGDEPHARASGTFDYMHPDQLAAIWRAGLDMQLHTHSHTMADCSADHVRAEIVRNRQELARILETDPSTFRHFCYPSGRHHQRVGPVLQQMGIASAVTVERGLAGPEADPYFLPRFLDGDEIPAIVFEAELAGVKDLAKALMQRLRKPAGVPFHAADRGARQDMATPLP